MAATPYCPEIDVDLSRVDVEVSIESGPEFDVEVIQPDVIIEAVTVANQGPKGDPGPQGPAGADSTVPGPPGPAGSAGVPGPPGPTGSTGTSLVVKGTVPNAAALPTTGNTSGDIYTTVDTGHGWGWNGTAWVDMGLMRGPGGPPGATGAQGAQGDPGGPGPAGSAATATAGTTSTGAPGTNANVTNVGTTSAAVFNFAIPRGDVGATGATGATGPQGAASTVPGPTGPTGATGGTGPQGSPGAAATIAAGTTATGAPGTNAAVSNVGTSAAAVFNFTIPRGDVGATGPQGNTGATGAASTVPGPQGPAGPSTPSANTGNLLATGSDSLLYLPASAIQPTIWSVRLRSFSSIGNGNFEIDQRNVHTGLVNPASLTFLCDRWQLQKSALTAAVNVTPLNMAFGSEILLPGTSFAISKNVLQFTVTTAQASLGVNDFYQINQFVEGSQMRELAQDVHSISLLVQSTVAPLKFSVALRDTTGTPIRSLVKLCTLPTTAWTLIQLPAIPVWASGGLWSTSPGAAGYQICFCLAAGTNLTAAAADTWQNANVVGAPTMSNWLANSGAVFNCAFIQHEPGSQATTLMDKPFTQNYDECLRYYCKSYDYGTAVATVTAVGQFSCLSAVPAAATTPYLICPVYFPKPMAIAPSMKCYSPATGTLNAVRDAVGAVDRGITSFPGLGSRGFSQIQCAANISANSNCTFQYAADTGW